MPARSGLSELVLFASLGGALALFGSCSSPELHDPEGPTTVPSCEASSTCGAGGGGSLPPIVDNPIVSGPCSTGKCIGSEAGTYEGSVSPLPDATSEAAAPSDAGVVDGNDASRPADGGPG
jgi:hypothetical protein